MTDIVFKLFDLLLGGLLARRRERKALLRQFEAIKRDILYTSIVNDYPVKLHKLRALLIEVNLVGQPTFRAFFSKWLTNPIVVIGRPALNVFSTGAIQELHDDLAALQL